MSPETHENDIEIDVLRLFAELGWATGDLTREGPRTEGRADFTLPYLPRRLKAALARLNAANIMGLALTSWSVRPSALSAGGARSEAIARAQPSRALTLRMTSKASAT